jgi:hypothetical protein
MGARREPSDRDQRPQCLAPEWYAPRPWEFEPTIGQVDRAWWDPVGYRLVHAAMGHVRYACWSGTHDQQRDEHLPAIQALFVGPGNGNGYEGRHCCARSPVAPQSWP